MTLVSFFAQNTVAFTAAVFTFSLLIGSFLNVVILRLPKMMRHAWALEVADYQQDEAHYQALTQQPAFNLLTPASHCPHCQHRIRPWENIPLISWVLLRAHCSNCGAKISARYPAIEFTVALLSALIAWQFGPTSQALAALALLWCLVALTMIDYDTQLLPDSITLPLLWLGLLCNITGLFVALDQAVIGAVTGYLSLWSVYWLFKLATGKDGMGFGDFKLFAAFGAWFGWAALPLIILLSSAVGAVTGILMILVLGRDRQKPIPFGPYLCGAALLYLFSGEQILTWYMGTLP